MLVDHPMGGNGRIDCEGIVVGEPGPGQITEDRAGNWA